jgi:hypothetical protein
MFSSLLACSRVLFSCPLLTSLLISGLFSSLLVCLLRFNKIVGVYEQRVQAPLRELLDVTVPGVREKIGLREQLMKDFDR